MKKISLALFCLGCILLLLIILTIKDTYGNEERHVIPNVFTEEEIETIDPGDGPDIIGGGEEPGGEEPPDVIDTVNPPNLTDEPDLIKTDGSKTYKESPPTPNSTMTAAKTGDQDSLRPWLILFVVTSIILRYFLLKRLKPTDFH